MFEITPSNAKQWSRLGSRGVFGQAILSAAENHPEMMVMSADLGNSSGLDRFKKTYPNQFLNVGIAEQNMIGVASGLAKEGYNVFATSFAPFISMRAAEQIRMNLGYMEMNVKAVAIGSGVSMAFLGNSHYGIEDAAVMRAIPNMTIVSPADCSEIFKVVEASASFKGPMYIRLTGAVNNPPVYTEDYDFKIGRAITLKKGSDVNIIACGTMVYESLVAAKILEEKGLSVGVLNMHTIKPIDTEAINQIYTKSKIVITVEEHSIIGGLGSAVAEYISEFKNNPPLLRLGLPDAFGKTGDYRYLLDKYNLVGSKIANSIWDFFKKQP
jgi:transketolase